MIPNPKISETQIRIFNPRKISRKVKRREWCSGKSLDLNKPKNPNEDTASVEKNTQEYDESREEKSFEKSDKSSDRDEGNKLGNDNLSISELRATSEGIGVFELSLNAHTFSIMGLLAKVERIKLFKF